MVVAVACVVVVVVVYVGGEDNGATKDRAGELR